MSYPRQSWCYSISYSRRIPLDEADSRSPAKPIRVTAGGNSSFFNGVPDWVYEEEVLEGDHALWWSPDSNSIAYLALDETKVPIYDVPIYNPTASDDSSEVHPYPSSLSMRYPKVCVHNVR